MYRAHRYLLAGGIFLLLAGGLPDAGRASDGRTMVPAPGPALGRTQIVPEETVQADVRSVIERQLRALQARDAAGAFAFLTPAHQTQYKNDPKIWLTAIRLHEHALYNHTGFRFLDQTPIGQDTLYRVELSSRRGEKSQAIFRLRQEADGWRIQSIAILKDGDERGA